MKLYIVIALSVGGLGNRIFNSGETVTEKNFPEGNAALLVEQGFLKEVDADQDAEKEAADLLAKEALEREAFEKKQQEEADRIAKEQADKLEAKEAERKAVEDKAKQEEADRIAKEEAEKEAAKSKAGKGR